MARLCTTALLLLPAITACTSESNPYAVGLLESDRVELAAEFAEPVRARHVREGDTVAAGALLMELDSTRAETALLVAEARVAETEARLAEMLRGPRPEQIRAARADVAGATDDAKFQELELQRAEEVFARKLAAQETVDRARAGYDVAKAKLAAAEARLEELLAGTTVEELRQVEQQLEQHRAAASAQRINLARHSLHAPADGIVDTLLLEPGELPAPGSTAIVMLTGAQPYARIYVPEEIRVHVSPGLAATIHVDGLAETLAGTVRWVSSDAAFTPYYALTEHDRGRLAFAAKIDIDYNGSRLPDGVPVQVEFDLPVERL